VEDGNPLVISPINEGQQVGTKGPAQSVAEKLPLVTCAEPRRSIKLKVKGTHSSLDQSVGRTSLNSSSCPLFDNFPFTRLTVEEIVELFSSYRIKLGDNAQHREQIILVIQTSSRISFENTIKQVIDKSKTNLYEMVIVYPHTISEGLIDFT
jgi:hypothetical protein